jgi:hypothetical protein
MGFMYQSFGTTCGFELGWEIEAIRTLRFFWKGGEEGSGVGIQAPNPRPQASHLVNSNASIYTTCSLIPHVTPIPAT